MTPMSVASINGRITESDRLLPLPSSSSPRSSCPPSQKNFARKGTACRFELPSSSSPSSTCPSPRFVVSARRQISIFEVKSYESRRRDYVVLSVVNCDMLTGPYYVHLSQHFLLKITKTQHLKIFSPKIPSVLAMTRLSDQNVL